MRRYRWGLSRPTKFIAVFAFVTLGVIAFLNAYHFLAITERVEGDVLVVEGWVHSYAITASVAELKHHPYRQIFTTGGPVAGNGGYINDYQTSASVGAGLLKRAGIPTELIQMVPSHTSGRDRTYSSAIALKDWLREHNVQVRSLNIITESAHARRTRLLFKRALGPDVNVGVIAVPSPDYDAKRWWRYSEGVQEVIGETVAYIYAKFLFHP